MSHEISVLRAYLQAKALIGVVAAVCERVAVPTFWVENLLCSKPGLVFSFERANVHFDVRVSLAIESDNCPTMREGYGRPKPGHPFPFVHNIFREPTVERN